VVVRGRGEEEGPGRPIRLCAQAKRTRASSWPKLHNPTPPKLGLHQNNINPTKSLPQQSPKYTRRYLLDTDRQSGSYRLLE